MWYIIHLRCQGTLRIQAKDADKAFYLATGYYGIKEKLIERVTPSN